MFLFFHRFGEAWTLGMLAALALLYCLRLLRDFKERLYIILTICSTDICWNQMKSLTNLFWFHVIRRELGWIWFHVIHIHLLLFFYIQTSNLWHKLSAMENSSSVIHWCQSVVSNQIPMSVGIQFSAMSIGIFSNQRWLAQTSWTISGWFPSQNLIGMP